MGKGSSNNSAPSDAESEPICPTNNNESKCSPLEPATRKNAANVPRGTASSSKPVPSGVPTIKLRKTRRGKRNSKKFCNKSTENSFDILHSNIRGYYSKKLSLKSIYQSINPSVITINEVGLKKNKKLELPGYSSYNKNRMQKAMGGVATAIKKNEAGFTLMTAEGNDDNEFIITRHA